MTITASRLLEKIAYQKKYYSSVTFLFDEVDFIAEMLKREVRCVDLDVPDGEDRSKMHASGRTKAGNDISGI
jgi:hypothetical protein